MERERVCKRCGRTFNAKAPRHVYCSDYCRMHAKIKWETCAVCGKTFMAKKGKTCSQECANILTVMHRKDENYSYEKKIDMSKFHSESLDQKAKEWGPKYGEFQARETLAMVPKIDVEGFMKSLK